MFRKQPPVAFDLVVDTAGAEAGPEGGDVRRDHRLADLVLQLLGDAGGAEVGAAYENRLGFRAVNGAGVGQDFARRHGGPVRSLRAAIAGFGKIKAGHGHDLDAVRGQIFFFVLVGFL